MNASPCTPVGWRCCCIVWGTIGHSRQLARGWQLGDSRLVIKRHARRAGAGVKQFYCLVRGARVALSSVRIPIAAAAAPSGASPRPGGARFIVSTVSAADRFAAWPGIGLSSGETSGETKMAPEAGPALSSLRFIGFSARVFNELQHFSSSFCRVSNSVFHRKFPTVAVEPSIARIAIDLTRFRRSDKSAAIKVTSG